MNFVEHASRQLLEYSKASKVAFVKCEPETPDFTANQEFRLIVYMAKGKVEIPVNRGNVGTVAGVLTASVFCPEVIETLLCWDIKPLFSYLRHYLPKPSNPTNNLLDLKVIESFLGISEKAPENISAAINRSKRIAGYKSWKKLYKSLHLPLITEILPEIETTPVLSEIEKTAVYSYYELEGQKNGRLRCHKAYHRGYIPHTMGSEVKASLKPRSRQDIFMYADINNCEVSVLQWLTGDTALLDIINSGEVYSGIYKAITGDDCDTDNKRTMCKLMFLPVIYGCGARGLSENLKVPEQTGRELIKRIHVQFPTSIEWVMNKQREYETNGIVEDYHGRPRNAFDAPYKVRNFVVQAPAATVCLEKLVLISRGVKEFGARVGFTVHDGYGIIVEPTVAKATFDAVKSIVHQDSALCPGLKLAMHAQFGRKLSSLKTFWK